MPFYTCDSLLEPAIERGINVEWYALDEHLAPMGLSIPGNDELIVLVDHFGVRSTATRALAVELGPRAILDETHAFYAGAPPAGLWSFNSARKFFGVPDGGYVFGPHALPPPGQRNTKGSADHLVLGALGETTAALEAFRANEAGMMSDIVAGSVLGKALLSRYDHRAMRAQRAMNAARAHEVLGHLNELDIELDANCAPLCYPLLLKEPVALAPLHAAGLFIPRYWPELQQRSRRAEFAKEVERAERLIAFPIDQRYSVEEVEQWAERLIALINGGPSPVR